MSRFKVNATTLNIRSGPSTSYEIISALTNGDIIEEAMAKEWCPIEMDDNSVGWVARKYLTQTDEVVPTPITTKPTGKQVVAKAMTQNKDPYIYGYEVDLNDLDPKAFDCSELVQWDCSQLKVSPTMPDGAANQYEHCKKYGTLISIEKAVKTVGALLFRISESGNHVVISRGDGSTIEAKGSAYGVGVFSATGRGFTHAALIPGVTY